jgi:hypothetical protein
MFEIVILDNDGDIIVRQYKLRNRVKVMEKYTKLRLDGEIQKFQANFRPPAKSVPRHRK